jgi:hypothetical protein
MNLLMTAPLLDSRGTLRYFIGAQIDVTGLVKDGTELQAFQGMRQRQQNGETHEEPKDEFQELSKMFNNTELDIVRKHGGNMHREVVQDQDDNSIQGRPRVLIQDQSTFDHIEEGQKLNPNVDGKLSGPYKHVSLLGYTDTRFRELTLWPVSPRPPRTISPHPLFVTVSPRPGNPTVALPRPYRRQQSCPRFSRQRTRRWFAWCNGQDPLALSRCFGPRRLLRGGPTTLDPLHTPPRRLWLRRRVDGCAYRRRQACWAFAPFPSGTTNRERCSQWTRWG